MQFIYYLFFIAFVSAGFTSASISAPRELLLIHPGAPGSLYEVSANEFARRANVHLPAAYKVTVAADAELGDGPGLLAKLTKEEAAFVLPSAAMTSVSDSFAIFELPFLIRNREQIRNIRGALLDSYLQPAAEHNGFHILGIWESGFRHFTNSVRRIERPSDLEGLKFAVPANGWREKVLQAFRAQAVPMASRAVPDALNARIVDGQEAPLVEIHTNQLPDVQRHLALSDHLYSPAFLLTRKAAFESLPASVQAVLAAEAEGIDRWIYSTAIEMESELVDRLDQRMTITHIDAGAFKEAGRTVYREFIRTVHGGAKMIELVETLDEVTATGSQPK